MRIKIKAFLSIGILSLAILAGCNGQKSSNKNSQAEKTENETGLTDFQIKNGIGPVTKAVEVPDTVGIELAKKGQEVFENNCTSCHRLDSRYVGPPLRGVTDTRTPAYIMNMVLNPEGMIAKHPIAKSLLGQYASRMANRHLSRDEARAIVEYLRYRDKHPDQEEVQ